MKVRKALVTALITMAVGVVGLVGAPAATAGAGAVGTVGAATTARDDGPPDCNADRNGWRWTDPINGRSYQCMYDNGYWAWVWLA